MSWKLYFPPPVTASISCSRTCQNLHHEIFLGRTETVPLRFVIVILRHFEITVIFAHSCDHGSAGLKTNLYMFIVHCNELL